jgi:hypothetical protein
MRGTLTIPGGLAPIGAMINRTAIGRRLDAGGEKLRPVQDKRTKCNDFMTYGHADLSPAELFNGAGFTEARVID